MRRAAEGSWAGLACREQVIIWAVEAWHQRATERACPLTGSPAHLRPPCCSSLPPPRATPPTQRCPYARLHPPVPLHLRRASPVHARRPRLRPLVARLRSPPHHLLPAAPAHNGRQRRLARLRPGHGGTQHHAVGRQSRAEGTGPPVPRTVSEVGRWHAATSWAMAP